MAKTYGNWVGPHRVQIAMEQGRRGWLGRLRQPRRIILEILLSVFRGISKRGFASAAQNLPDADGRQQATDEIRDKAYLDIARMIR